MTFEEYSNNRDKALLLLSDSVYRNALRDKANSDKWFELLWQIKEAMSQRSNDYDMLIEHQVYDDYWNHSDEVRASDLLQKMYELSWQPY